jgi:membrane-bound lytic murein transglycosylase D
MEYRTKLLYVCLLLAVALSLAGCGFNQQAKFQMGFLPPAPEAGGPVELSEPPVVQPNLYLQNAPTFITPVSAPSLKTRGDALVQRAGERFDRGKRLYQSQEFDSARREFDAAVDLMLEAADYNPADRQVYERRLDQMVDSIHRYDLGGLGAASSTEDARFEKAPLEDILQMTFPVDPKLKDKVRDQVLATVSQLPLSVNDAVLGYIHYFSSRGRRTMINGLQRSGRYRPLIQRILDEEGVPQELIHLAQAESGFYPRAVSSANAGGMWQFMSWRGQHYGLMQTRYTDDRMDPEKATRAAARHLRDLYHEFGDWYLALAAYNCGPGTVEKAVERTGYADFWKLRERGVLPAETTNYVPIILAMTIMEKNAAEYGLDNITLESPVEYDTLEVTAPTSLALIADLTDTPVTELAGLNPSVLRNVAPEGYALHVPKGTGNSVVAALQLVPAERRAAWRMHRVSGGETLAAIAKRYGSAPSSIASANRLQSAAPADGDRLLIPAALREAPAAKRAVRSSSSRSARSSHSSRAARSSSSRAASSHSASARSASSHSTAARSTTARRRSGSASSTARKAAVARRKSPPVLTHTASR